MKEEAMDIAEKQTHTHKKKKEIRTNEKRKRNIDVTMVMTRLHYYELGRRRYYRCFQKIQTKMSPCI